MSSFFHYCFYGIGNIPLFTIFYLLISNLIPNGDKCYSQISSIEQYDQKNLITNNPSCVPGSLAELAKKYGATKILDHANYFKFYENILCSVRNNNHFITLVEFGVNLFF